MQIKWFSLLPVHRSPNICEHTQTHVCTHTCTHMHAHTRVATQQLIEREAMISLGTWIIFMPSPVDSLLLFLGEFTLESDYIVAIH
jgi:hypothetical protein